MVLGGKKGEGKKEGWGNGRGGKLEAVRGIGFRLGLDMVLTWSLE